MGAIRPLHQDGVIHRGQHREIIETVADADDQELIAGMSLLPAIAVNEHMPGLPLLAVPHEVIEKSSMGAAESPRLGQTLHLPGEGRGAFDHERFVILPLLGQDRFRRAETGPLGDLLRRHVPEASQRAPQGLLDLLERGAQPDTGYPQLDHLEGAADLGPRDWKVKIPFGNEQAPAVLNDKRMAMFQIESERLDLNARLARSQHQWDPPGSKGAQRLLRRLK